MATCAEYQLSIISVTVLSVSKLDITPQAKKVLVEWKLRALSQQLQAQRQYSMAMWARLLAGSVHHAASVNEVLRALKDVTRVQPPTSNRGVNSDVNTTPIARHD